MSYEKPIPSVDEINRPFWDSVKARQLKLPKCRDCEKFHAPPRQFCPHCLSDQLEWLPVSGKGVIYSYVIYHQAYDQSFAGDVPYNVAVIELEEGPRLLSNVIGSNDEIRVGDAVRVVYEDVTDEIALHRFERA
jgi:uncharacterized OB-fold protein